MEKYDFIFTRLRSLSLADIHQFAWSISVNKSGPSVTWGGGSLLQLTHPGRCHGCIFCLEPAVLLEHSRVIPMAMVGD